MSTESSEGPGPELLKVRDFAQAYIVTFNGERHRLANAGARAALYAQELGPACVAVAHDGIAIFYFNKETQAQAPFTMPDGDWLYDFSGQHRAAIVQSFTSFAFGTQSQARRRLKRERCQMSCPSGSRWAA